MGTYLAGRMTAFCLRHEPRWLLAATLGSAVLLLTVVPAAGAQQVDPREIKARSECLAGRYQVGADLLAEMYAETRDVNYIYNQGRCFEQNGKLNEAILRFREYLRKAKNMSAEEKAEVKNHITECQAELDNPPAPVPSRPSPTEVVPAPRPAVGRSAPDNPSVAAVPNPTVAVEATPSQPPEGSSGVTLRNTGIVTASLGIVAVGSGVIFGVMAKNIADEVAADAARHNYSRSKDDRGKLLANLQWVGYGVGAAGLVAGGVLYYFGYQAAHSPGSNSVSFLPLLLPGGSGVVAQGRF